MTSCLSLLRNVALSPCLVGRRAKVSIFLSDVVRGEFFGIPSRESYDARWLVVLGTVRLILWRQFVSINKIQLHYEDR
jgi:hypothetical protein